MGYTHATLTGGVDPWVLQELWMDKHHAEATTMGTAPKACKAPTACCAGVLVLVCPDFLSFFCSIHFDFSFQMKKSRQTEMRKYLLC
jgi:hypothetical protein